MLPKITFGVVVIALLAYFIGARYPVLAQKVGLA